jgi:hypothetical protein
MRSAILSAVCSLSLIGSVVQAGPRSALEVLGRDYAFPNQIQGLPGRLPDFEDLRIGTFETSDGVKLAYWEAGTGRPLVFVPGWSSNGAECVNVLYLLRSRYHVYLLDLRAFLDS